MIFTLESNSSLKRIYKTSEDITFPPFDFKIVTSAGVIRRNNVNVCEVTLYTIYD